MTPENNKKRQPQLDTNDILGKFVIFVKLGIDGLILDLDLDSK
jgi:hypothetical protein